MLSKKEREYLSGELKLSKNYQRKIEHSIRKKLGVFRELELPLLRRSEVIGGEASYLGKLTSCQSGLTPPKETRLFLTKNDDAVTEFGANSFKFASIYFSRILNVCNTSFENKGVISSSRTATFSHSGHLASMKKITNQAI